jgi:hypothetical protein
MNEHSFISMALAYVIGVGRKVLSWTVIGANRMERGKGPTYVRSKGFWKVYD